jgi:hypothetical protein
MRSVALGAVLGSLILGIAAGAGAQAADAGVASPAETSAGEVASPAETATTPPVDDDAIEDDADDIDDDAVAADAVQGDDAVAEDVVATLGNVVGSQALSGSAEPTGPQHRVVWREDWPRYSFDEAILSLGMGALLLAAELLPTATTSANWTGGILFDQGVREGLRLRAVESRESARVASEVLQWVLIGTPFVIDALAAAGIGDGNWDAAFQMGLISLESYIIALVVWKVTVLLARRERPLAVWCAGEGSGTAECNDELETTSFFSNQAVNAFTGASLICLHHTHMPLFGDEAADVSACVVGMTSAAIVGLLRVMSDREYLTDVLMGAIVGFVAGYIIPWAVHYQGGARPELRPAPPIAVVPVPMIAPGDTYGVQIAGWF